MEWWGDLDNGYMDNELDLYLSSKPRYNYQKAPLMKGELNMAVKKKIVAAKRSLAERDTLKISRESGRMLHVAQSEALFLQAMAALYSGDSSAPGIVASFISDRAQFYASVVRYNDFRGQGKQVVVAVYGSTLEDAKLELMEKWYEKIDPLMNFGKVLTPSSSNGIDWRLQQEAEAKRARANEAMALAQKAVKEAELAEAKPGLMRAALEQTRAIRRRIK